MMIPAKVAGMAVDHTSVRIMMPFGKLFISHAKSVDYDDSLAPSENMGFHPIPLPRGLGVYKANANMVVTKEAFDSFLDLAPDGYGALVFPVTINYIPKGSYLPRVDEWFDASIVSVKNAVSTGQGGLDISLGFYARFIKRNGKCLVPIDNDVTPVFS